MLTLVTGATGLVGNALARRLADGGQRVRALVRDLDRARPILPGVELVRGDITEPASLVPALAGVARVFHAAGMPEQWQRDEGVFDRVNHLGTANVLAAARTAGVARVIYTSTMDVFAAPRGGTLVETNLDPHPKHTAYERSKQAADRAAEAIRADGLDVVHVNPAAVYGPGPVHVALNGVFIRLLTGKMPMVPPGGMSVVYVDGVVDAHLAAADRGVSGERYLVSDGYASNRELCVEIARQAGLRKVPRDAPAWLLRGLAGVSAPLARLFRFSPLIAPGQLTFILWQARVDSAKAQRELGFAPTPLATGVERTLGFLRAEGLVPAAA
ncbi:MAG: NAD-dependent epimerase/dehydratase family protein [Myxococcales bacterium]|nr:NAD-dependent epimerase/dehydratase family protein [Myxococcales bacterium]